MNYTTLLLLINITRWRVNNKGYGCHAKGTLIRWIFMAWHHLAFTQSPSLSIFNLNCMYWIYYSYCYVYNRISMQLSIVWTIAIFTGWCSHVHVKNVCKLNCKHQILNLKFRKSHLACFIFSFVVIIFGLTNDCQKGSFYFIMAFSTIFDFSVNV